MQASELKNYILNNDLSEEVLTSIGCHKIRNHGDYITAANPDGDNASAIVVYLNDNLTCIDYTRSLIKGNRATDIIDLVSFCRECTFVESIKFIHEQLGLDIYSEPDDIPESLQILQLLREMSSGCDESAREPLKPISEKVLRYYMQLPNKMFLDDGISIEVQEEFEVGYDTYSGYITIPIRDGFSNLVGVKGRWFGANDASHIKYVYLEKCNKSKVLFGYCQNKDFIKKSKYIYIVESEKGVMQLASIGVRNCVATGGKTISKTQVELITRTGCIPIFAYDQDCGEDELESIADMFINGVDVYAVIDRDGLLDEKESPSDNTKKWKRLVKNNVYKISTEGVSNDC